MARQTPICDLAAVLVLVDPAGLGGLRLQAQPNPSSSVWLERFRALAATLGPFVRLPHHAEPERLLGGLDWTSSLAQSSPVWREGLIAQAAGGVLLARMADRLASGLAGPLAQALDTGSVRSRSGKPSNFALVMLDESLDDEPGPPALLCSRVAFHLHEEAPGALPNALPVTLPVSLPVALPDALPGALPGALPDAFSGALPDALSGTLPDASLALCAIAASVARARRHLGSLELRDQDFWAVVQAAAQLGVDDLRALCFTVRAARAMAALRSAREQPDPTALLETRPVRIRDDDLAQAIAMVLGPRAMRLPDLGDAGQSAADQAAESSELFEPAEAAGPTEACARTEADTGQAEATAAESPGVEPFEATPATPSSSDAHELGCTADALLAQAMLLAASQALLPPALRALWQRGEFMRTRAQPVAAAGRSSDWAPGGSRGRVLNVRAGLPGGRTRINLVATLRAAAPWQLLRQRGAWADERPRHPLRVAPEDLRINRYAQRRQSTTVFVVDASGSAALHRLAEVKGAVELLLAECYVRRDEVAVIAFRLDQAQTLLPPTRSLVRAKRRLAALPGGGGTPLAHALELGARLIDALRRKGQRVQLVVLSDGKANVDVRGKPGREQAMADALACARGLRQVALGVARLAWVDTAPRPSKEAQTLAERMGAQYMALPYADAAGIHALARQLSPAGARAAPARASRAATVI
jgi:magnesium chelatase subunit D